VTGSSMSGDVRSDRFRWGHVGTGCSGRTVHIGTGLDRTGQFGTGRDRPGHVWTYLDMSEQVGKSRDMLVHIFWNRTDMSGQVATGLDSSRQFGYRSGRVRTCRDMLVQLVTGPSMSGHFRTHRLLEDISGQVVRLERYRSGQVCTGLDMWEQVVTGRDVFGHVGTCRYSSGYVGTGLS